jgi:hypothetical protein
MRPKCSCYHVETKTSLNAVTLLDSNGILQRNMQVYFYKMLQLNEVVVVTVPNLYFFPHPDCENDHGH